MNVRNQVSRRRFFGGVAATVSAISLSKSELFAQQAPGTQATATTQQFGCSDADYDKIIKLASNENNYGLPKAVMDSMQGAWKYASRYGYPDGDVVEVIAAFHGLQPENVLLTAGDRLSRAVDRDAPEWTPPHRVEEPRVQRSVGPGSPSAG